MIPRLSTASYVGLRPATPQSAAGLRTEPLVSEPMPTRTMPAATAAAVPLDDPPGERVTSQGLSTGGRGKSHDGAAKENSWQASLPTMTAPHSPSRWATAE